MMLALRCRCSKDPEPVEVVGEGPWEKLWRDGLNDGAARKIVLAGGDLREKHQAANATPSSRKLAKRGIGARRLEELHKASPQDDEVSFRSEMEKVHS